jgi:hydrogenase maturation protease
LSNKLVVAGLGNTLRKDDAIGILVLESLISRGRKDGVDYFDYGIASFDLLHRIKDYDKALLIDGIEASLEYGELKTFKLEEAQYTVKSAMTSSHEIGLRDLFELCGKFDVKTRIYVAGIQVKDVLFGEGLSEELGSKFDKISKEVDKFIDVLRDTRKSIRDRK